MSPDLFLKLSELALSREQMAGVIDVLKCMEADHEAKVEKSREKARARLQKWREKPENVSKRFKASQNVLKPLAGGEGSSSKEDISGKENKKERATRLPKDWTLPVDWLEEAVAAGLTHTVAIREAVKMHNWSLSDKNGAKLDWRATWQNWYLRALESQSKSTGPPRNGGIVGAAERILESKANGSESIFGSNGDAQRLSTGRSLELGSPASDIRSGIGRQFARSGH